jgi:hypothetical protein
MELFVSPSRLLVAEPERGNRFDATPHARCIRSNGYSGIGGLSSDVGDRSRIDRQSIDSMVFVWERLAGLPPRALRFAAIR